MKTVVCEPQAFRAGMGSYIDKCHLVPVGDRSGSGIELIDFTGDGLSVPPIRKRGYAPVRYRKYKDMFGPAPGQLYRLLEKGLELGLKFLG